MEGVAQREHRLHICVDGRSFDQFIVYEMQRVVDVSISIFARAANRAPQCRNRDVFDVAGSKKSKKIHFLC